MRKLAPYFLIAFGVAVGLKAQDGVIDPKNLGNGWYPNLPAVSVEKLQPVIDCLVAAGAPPNPTFETRENVRLSTDLAHGPTILRWKLNGRPFENDAVLTYYSPQVAYVEIANAFNLPRQVVDCSPKAKVVVAEVTNPIGQLLEGYTDRYSSAPGDKFAIGATYTDSRGTWTKKRGWRAFFPYGYWSLQ